MSKNKDSFDKRATASALEYIRISSQLPFSPKSALKVKTQQESVSSIQDSLSENDIICKKSGTGKIGFSSVNIRSYGMTLGDNPSVTLGPPLTIEWEHFDSITIPVADYELKRRTIRTRQSYKIPFILRERILLMAGFGKSELHQADMEIAEIKKERMSSAHQPAIKELLEKGTQSIQRKLKRWIHRTPSDRVLYDKWIDELDGIIAKHSETIDVEKQDNAHPRTENDAERSITAKDSSHLPSSMFDGMERGEEKDETAASHVKISQEQTKPQLHQLDKDLYESKTAGSSMQISLDNRLGKISSLAPTINPRKMAEILGLKVKGPKKENGLSSKRRKNNDGDVLTLISSMKRLSSSNLMRCSSSGRIIGESSRSQMSGEKNATFDVLQAPMKDVSLKRQASTDLMRNSLYSNQMLRESSSAKLSAGRNANFDLVKRPTK